MDDMVIFGHFRHSKTISMEQSDWFSVLSQARNSWKHTAWAANGTISHYAVTANRNFILNDPQRNMPYYVICKMIDMCKI